MENMYKLHVTTFSEKFPLMFETLLIIKFKGRWKEDRTTWFKITVYVL